MVYEYKCSECGKEFEVERSLTDESPQKCERGCTEGECTRLISTTAFSLKGTGWFNSGGY